MPSHEAPSDEQKTNQFLFLLFRLHEALIYNNEHQASHMCKLMLKHFDFDPSDDVLRDLEIANRETLGKSDSSVISIYGLDLSEKKNVKKLIALFSRCPKVKKIELVFCSLSNEIAFKVFEATMKLETLHYLGKCQKPNLYPFTLICQNLIDWITKTKYIYCIQFSSTFRYSKANGFF